MILVIDVGNTNITCGVFNGEKLVSSFRMTTGFARTSDEYGVFLADWLLLNGFKKEDITDVIISSALYRGAGHQDRYQDRHGQSQ